MSAVVYPTPQRARPSLGEWGGRIEGFAVAAILFLMSQALLAPLFSPDQNPDSVPWLRTIWLPVYGVIALLLLARPLALTRVAVPALMGLALSAWTFASTRWSIEPDVTTRRSVALLFTTLFGLYLAARYDWKALLEMFAGLFFALAVGAAIAAVLFPGFGANDPIHPGAWNGLWYQKNQTGGLMATGALVAACAALFAPERRKLWLAALAACLVATVMTRSTTSVVAAAIGLGGFAMVVLLRRGGAVGLAVAWAAIGLGGLLLAVMAIDPDLAFGLLGKDSSLTGRTGIWAAVLRQVEKHYLTGYGFGAVWGEHYGPAWFIRQEVKWNVPTAHNGWLDVLLQLGMVGLVLCVLHFAITSVAALARLYRGPDAAMAIPFLAMFGLLSTSESTILQFNGLPWLMYVLVGAKLFEWNGLSGARPPRAPRVKLFPD